MSKISVSKNQAGSVTARWFSENPSKAWGEKFFLIYSPIWVLLMALSSRLGLKNLGEIGSLIQACIIALPLLIIPLLIRNETGAGRSWYQTYWFKANLYIFIFSFFGNYFGSEYFFDVLGMNYNYPHIKLTLDAKLVGSGLQHVPITMYIMTQAYFMTYHTTAVIVLRRIRTLPVSWSKWLFIPMIVVIGYIWAWLETRIMASPFNGSSFYYTNLNRMLSYGSLIYVSYFITSFPIFYNLDEKTTDNWGILRTIGAALSASMLTFFLLDFWAWFIGHI